MQNTLEQEITSSSLSSRDTDQHSDTQHLTCKYRPHISTARVKLSPLGPTQWQEQVQSLRQTQPLGQAQKLRQTQPLEQAQHVRQTQPLEQAQQVRQTQSLQGDLDKPSPSHKHRLMYLSIGATVAASLAAGVILLLSDVFAPPFLHAPVSAVPLLLVGSTYLGFLALIRPKPLDLFKALIVSVAFLLWGIDQLLPTGWFATMLGDVVIVLYVIDLGWMIADRLRELWKSRHAQ